MAGVLDKSVKLPAVGEAPVIPVGLIVSGLYLCWFGIHYWGSDTKWPTDPIKAILTGKPIPAVDRSATEQALKDLQGAAQAGTAVGTAVGAAPGGAGAAAATRYSSHQARMALWTANGGNPATADLAAAVSQAENQSGNPAATSPNPDGGTNVGLWQLDTRGVGAGYTIDELADPNTNARITVMATANGTNWSQWQTYHDDTYKQFL